MVSGKYRSPQRIWALLTPAERRRAVGLLLLMLVGMLLETLGVGLVVPAIALLTQPDLTETYPALHGLLDALGDAAPHQLIVGGMAALVCIYVGKAIFLALLAWRQARFAFDVQAHLSQRLFALYLRQPYTFHLQRNSAQLIRNVIGEVGMFTIKGMLPMMTLLTECLVLLSLSILLVVFEPLGATIVLAVLGVASWGFHGLTRKRIGRWGEARLYHEGLRMQHLQQGLGGAKDVKLLGRETEFLSQYAVHNFRSARVAELQITLQQLPRLWLEVLAVSGMAILVVSMLAQGKAIDAVLPTLGLFAASAFRLIPSVNRILGSLQSLRYGLPVIDVLHTELQMGAPETATAVGEDIGFHKTVDLDRITYTYPGASEPALRDVSLTVHRGESVGFVGTSGAGKSTLVDILLGLLTPDSGEVRVDGRNIQSALRQWQDQIGYVPQSVFLTDDTLRRNVAFGLAEPDIDEAALRRALKAAQLEDFVESLPAGLDTVVGERGIRISGGQRQRIGIARALYHDPAVLVLDEATSSLDSDTERGVMAAVTALHGAKTIIIVAHRLSTVESCDRLYRIEQRNVVAEGSPLEMLSAQRILTLRAN